MFLVEIQKYQAVILSLLGGGLLTILLTLGYFAMWTPRLKKENGKSIGDRAGWKMTWRFQPWIVILIVIGITIFSVAFMVQNILQPPNW